MHYRDKSADAEINDDQLDYLEIRTYNFDLYLFLYNPESAKHEGYSSDAEVRQNVEFYENELQDLDPSEHPQESEHILHLLIRDPFDGKIIQNDYLRLNLEEVKELTTVIGASGLIELNGEVNNTRGIPDSAGYLDVDARYSNGQKLYYRENGYRNHLLLTGEMERYLVKRLLPENKDCLSVLKLFPAPSLDPLYISELSYKMDWDDGEACARLKLRREDENYYISGFYTDRKKERFEVPERQLTAGEVNDFFQHFADYQLNLEFPDSDAQEVNTNFILRLPNGQEVGIMALIDQQGERKYPFELEEFLMEIAAKAEGQRDADP
ncbi:MAG: hypothetical protein Q4P65_01955 [Eubacteriales bacterium]|nr:hypothetical protein [Eubacteriales bacterium]